MKRTLLALAALTATAASAQTMNRPIELGLSAGYAGGLSGEAFVHAPGLYGPFGVKAGVSFTGVTDPFTLDTKSTNPLVYATANYCATVGGCSSDGNNVVIGLDGTYALGEVAPGIAMDAYLGARYGLFSRSISALGATTTYNMNSFGLGGGLMVGYAINPGISVFGDLGADYFFDSAVTSSTGSSSLTTNPGQAGYNDVRGFANFPGVTFKARVGVKFIL